MKFSINLAQHFSNVDIKSIGRDEIVRRIGAQLGAIEDVTDWSSKFEGAVVVKIVSCEKHPNADKLSICRIDDGGSNQSVERGEDGLIQVVCGAPNVRSDMYAVWLAPGVTVPSSLESDPFVLEARDLRGVVSNGMLASASELAISEDHSGIISVTTEDAGKEIIPGEALVNYYNLDDIVIDCENKMFTHRPDCFGNLGIAREVAAINGLKFESPSWYLNSPDFDSTNELPLDSRNEAPELVPRFMTVAMSNVNIGPSPIWLQAALTMVGIKPISNVVDITNYAMHLTGQPLHAFDYDKVKALSDSLEIFPRKSNPGEKITLLGQKEIELTGEEIVISTDKQAIALAGVMGGADTEVDESTKNIIIECASFDMYNIRRTSMRFGLFTDAVTRFNKGQSPLQNDRVLAFAMRNIYELSGALQASSVLDINSGLPVPPMVKVSLDYINKRLGTELSADQMASLLDNAEIGVSADADNLIVSSPFWRMDIENPEDVVEEVGRLYGYDKLPVNLPLRTAKPTKVNPQLEFNNTVRQALKRAGANEVLTYSFVHGDLLRKVNINADEWTFHLRNAISPDLQYYRPSLIPSLLAKVHPNIKAQAGSDNNQFAIYEIGKAHNRKNLGEANIPLPENRLALVLAADKKTSERKQAGSAYYLAKKYVDFVTNGQAKYEKIDSFEDPLRAPFAEGRSARVVLGDKEVGIVGEFDSSVAASFKLPEFSAGFELDTDKLLGLLSPVAYNPLPSFPPTKQDITVEVGVSDSYDDVLTRINAQISDASSNHGYNWMVEPLAIFVPQSQDIKKLTFRINLWHADRTLTGEEVNNLINLINL